MIQLGKKQLLTIMQKVDFGVYLSLNKESEEKVLLPIKQVPEELDIMDTLEVFVYRDSKDRLIATTNNPKLEVGQIGVLKVAQTGTIGAFLDWGLEKDILLPYKEQTKELIEGEECLVRIYIDKSSRLCATMKVYEHLNTDSPYKKDDMVEGIVYEISDQFGAFVAVDDIFSALISRKELHSNMKVNDRITARVLEVKEDGKLSLGIREKAYIQMDIDAQKILEYFEKNSGVIPFTDKANPEIIKREFQMSKNQFKRAIGTLFKNRIIEIKEDRIIKK